MTEYRIEELANVTGTTVRTLLSYRNKGLLPAPRRQGRVALYSDDHIARLDLIADLIARGYSLNAVSELLAGLGRGERIHDLLGLDDTIEHGPGAAPVVTPRQMAEAVGADEIVLARLIELGVLRPTDDTFDGDPADQPYRVDLPVLFGAGQALVTAGIPFDAIIDEGFRLRRDAEAIARRFVELAVGHVVIEGAVAPGGRASSVTELVRDLVPFAPIVVAELVEVALRDSIHAEIERQIGHLLASERGSGDRTDDEP